MSGTLAPVLFTQVFAAFAGGALIGAPFLGCALLVGALVAARRGGGRSLAPA